MIEVTGRAVPGSDEILTPDALAFVADLQVAFGPRREALLQVRRDRQAAIDGGADLDFGPATADIREGDWTVPAAPADLDDRRVEITGPVEPKMMINALNSGARVFMADLEDSLSPTWANVVGGQLALRSAVRHELADDLTVDIVQGWKISVVRRHDSVLLHLIPV
jgi:malate synthase